MKFIPFLLILALAIPSYGGGVSRSRAKIVNSYHDANQVVIEQKVISYGDSLQIIAVPVTDVGLQYYYQSEPLRGRGLSDEDKDQIVQEVVAGVLKGLDERFEVVPTEGNPQTSTPPATPNPQPETPTSPGLTELDKQVLNLFINKCAICHTEGSLDLDGIPVLLTKDNQLKKNPDKNLETLKRFKVHDAVFYNRMPKNNTPLNETEVELLHKWIKDVN